jgi:hypothetical protein
MDESAKAIATATRASVDALAGFATCIEPD